MGGAEVQQVSLSVTDNVLFQCTVQHDIIKVGVGILCTGGGRGWASVLADR